MATLGVIQPAAYEISHVKIQMVEWMSCKGSGGWMDG